MGNSILNFPTKNHWRSPSRLQDIEDGLNYFIDNYQRWGITSIAFPPLGCGNGGLEWVDVGRLMYQKLISLPITIEMYAPYGTPVSQLSPEFLSRTVSSQNAKGISHKKLKNGWLAILEVIYQLSKQPYANPVGRTIFQKISFIMTELGVDTGFVFGKGSYGPFSDDLKMAMTIMANANLISERQMGRMTAIIPSEEYENRREELQSRIAPFQTWITKTVDLFSRIKNTEQAEEVTTIIFATQKLKQEMDAISVSEQDILDYIINWKKRWKKEPKQERIASGIRNLQMLGWIKLQYSESLPYKPFLSDM